MMLLISLAGKPKKEGALKTFCLMLGHDYISDHITVCLGPHCERDTVLCMIVQLCWQTSNFQPFIDKILMDALNPMYMHSSIVYEWNLFQFYSVKHFHAKLYATKIITNPSSYIFCVLLRIGFFSEVLFLSCVTNYWRGRRYALLNLLVVIGELSAADCNYYFTEIQLVALKIRLIRCLILWFTGYILLSNEAFLWKKHPIALNIFR